MRLDCLDLPTLGERSKANGLQTSCRASSYLQQAHEVCSFILHAWTKYPLHAGKDTDKVSYVNRALLFPIQIPYLASTDSGFFYGKLHNIDPRPVSSTEWRASRPPAGILNSNLAYRSHMRSPCGFPSALERHRGVRGCAKQVASSRQDRRIMGKELPGFYMSPIPKQSLLSPPIWITFITLDLYFTFHTHVG
jgi:hypothetical protein